MKESISGGMITAIWQKIASSVQGETSRYFEITKYGSHFIEIKAFGKQFRIKVEQI